MVKRPKGRPLAVPPKLPKSAQATIAISTESETPAFSFALIDKSPPSGVGWELLDHADRELLLDQLESVSRMTWREIRQMTAKGHHRYHSMGFGTLSPNAQQRITALNFNVRFNEIYRFRMTGAKRLWGFEEGKVFHIVWWDPAHLIYPTAV